MNRQKSGGNGFRDVLIWVACLILIKIGMSFITQLWLALHLGR